METMQQQELGQISVRPYFRKDIPNMGLEAYGLSLFPGAGHHQQLADLGQHGQVRYLTGLDEFAPEVKMITDKDKREAKIKEIRKAVVELEKELAGNPLDAEDPELWSKVKLLKSDNTNFWKKIDILCGSEPIFLDPKNPYDRIKIYAIEAGGFGMIAKSLEAARGMNMPSKFYLDKTINTLDIKTEIKKLRNKALAELQILFEKNPKKLFYVTKLTDLNSAQYKKNTPNDLMYENMDNFINGEGVEKSKQKAAKAFLQNSSYDLAELKIRCLIKDGGYYKIVTTKGDGHIWHNESNTQLGKNIEQVIEFLRDPLHEEILLSITKAVESLWNA